MTCAAVTVNRSLILLAIVWGVIPVAAFQAVKMRASDDAVAVHGMARSEPLASQADETRGLLPALSLAITQPNKKNARVTNGR